MAHRLAGPCATSRCNSLASPGKSRCEVCSSTQSKQLNESRGSASARGYDVEWRKFREWFLWQPENIMCGDCRTQVSREVHHVVKVRVCPERRLDPTNCLGLCKQCHQRRTNRGE
jgi:5-methylcytosine-specific restriction endonuclease McrA